MSAYTHSLGTNLQPIYLDCHATTPVDARVFEVMQPFFMEQFGNPASVNHSYGWKAAEAVEIARKQIGKLIKTDSRNIIFTSGATEANNLAIKGLLESAGVGSHLIISAVEHRSILDPAKRLKRAGYDVTILPVDEFGQIDLQQLENTIRKETALVSIIWANNEIGTTNNVKEILSICKERQVPFHSDAVQALGKISIDLQKVPLQLMSLSAHKLYGPQGVGALVVQKVVQENDIAFAIKPQLEGGGHQRGYRSGTLPVALIAGFGKACELAKELMIDEATRIKKMRDNLWQGLQNQLDGLVLNGHPEDRLPGNLNISIEGVDGEALMTSLKRIAVSSGSACGSANAEPSYVLKAIGRNHQQTRASLRFGIG
ncbi:Cysteine desulfurase, partial [hydrothermal vent metagenome]